MGSLPRPKAFLLFPASDRGLLPRILTSFLSNLASLSALLPKGVRYVREALRGGFLYLLSFLFPRKSSSSYASS